ncbi:MAG: PLP-dependent aminotransferase family protein [Chloroflexi bacterium]|nr:MAG: PLP-dependent aminotransferase family protein [Chloroflexota bacterium]MBL1195823.1 PLP-dependent aminotransferase family protein [Chloroflexota bacterium]NOH13115.1 PLP-dependent aminotransferase family protein [Chloroflexota bacterium]
MQTLWEHRFAGRVNAMTSSAIREILKLTAKPDIISFAGGLPSPDVFPVEEFQKACDLVLSETGKQALQYATTEGYLPLREMVARHTSRYGIKVSPDNIVITSGSQQALDLIGKIFINPGDRILVEEPTYLGALQAWNGYGAQYVTVPTDDDGMRLDELEKALRIGPKFIYVLPNFQNPTGRTMSLERRHKLVELADHYGVPIVEDDPYGQLRYDGEHLPPVVVLDAKFHENGEEHYTGNVLYTSTFSKTLAPGLRLAWLIAPPAVLERFVHAKQGSDLHTSSFNQMVAYEVARGGFLDKHIKTIRETYKTRRDLMLKGADEHLPAGVEWTRPEGGLFLWVTLPEHCDCKEVLEDAVEQKVAFVPGNPFYPLGGGENTFRLNFSNASHEQLETGMQRLGQVLQKHVGQLEKA